MPPIENAPSINNDMPDSNAGHQIVILTDSPVNRVVLSGTLARLGLKCRFLTFSNPTFNDARPSAVIIDCTGKTVGCEKILNMLANENRPKVLMITDAGEQREMAADYFVDKPMTSDKLEAAIHRLLGK